jgi:hypothetical protein
MVTCQGLHTADFVIIAKTLGKVKRKMATPEGVKPSTSGFVDRHSIQLSYGVVKIDPRLDSNQLPEKILPESFWSAYMVCFILGHISAKTGNFHLL